MKPVPKLILFAIFITCLILLFVDGPGSESPRSHLRLWDLGHLVLFFIGGILLLTDPRRFFKDTFVMHLLLIVIFSLALGLLTELVQVYFQRDPDLGDLTRDLIGGLLALIFFSTQRYSIPKLVLKGMRLLLLAAVLIEFYPTAQALLDEWMVHRQFPVLSNFETMFELSRWHHELPLHTDKTTVREGTHSMRVELTTAEYSTVAMRYFHANWNGYSTFNFSIFNAGSDTLLMTCRINDQQHYALHQNYNDRFNLKLRLAPGWNDFSIPITQLENAPKSRKMDLNQIKLICLFTKNLAEPRTIYIDNLYLSK